MPAPLNGKLVTVFGASGFVGRYVVRALAARGYRVRAACRRPDLAGQLQPYGVVGQIMPVQANIRPKYRASVAAAVAGADAVVNVVGILAERGKQSYDQVQAAGAGIVAEAAKAAGVARFVHVSAIGADADATTGYQRSKAAGEAAVLAAQPDAVIFRPSILFGQDDDFFNRFAGLARMTPVLPLFGGGKTRFQPAYVVDVAEAIARAVDGTVAAGVYELGGPEVKSFRDCMELVLAETHRKRLLVDVPFGVAKLFAMYAQHLPFAPITEEQVELLKVDNVVSDAAIAEKRTFAGLGITPSTLAAVLPSYLWRFRPTGQFDRKPA